ncbi:short-chain dehydrogenase [Sphingomonas sp. Leaf208]|uniref:SDR family NAD(P)-dependent oxidoreductase n=1 Tax=Sphingomonas sp. Leaf208 TaxID=1735679 RepID=UPI0006F8A717|nr:SDR family NAD(P)-dependent oxidoreductase [Sphingomonas sp. Leaf208]KQM52295.1 short-chain dehydrogenase [Sphingomonas sp. Leaf208]
MSFVGRSVLISGAAMGIGLTTAGRFLEHAADVWLADRDERALASACGDLPLARRDRAIVLDVTNEDDWADAASRIATAGGLDVLINNAGRGHFRMLADTSLAEWREIRAVNVDALFLGTRAMLPMLAASGSGAIVNVASIRGMISGPGSGSYCAAKGAARMFAKAAALEFAALSNRVRVNTVNPGLIDTPLSRAVFNDPAASARRLADIPLGRAGTAEEVADAIVFLASDAAAYITGAEVSIDGGQTAG